MHSPDNNGLVVSNVPRNIIMGSPQAYRYENNREKHFWNKWNAFEDENVEKKRSFDLYLAQSDVFSVELDEMKWKSTKYDFTQEEKVYVT